ncbi:MAG: hypothetical protein JW751_28465 [Polyangiaceae bacterium]|nr:hypothetical protein [Polyangiaceae bacterium]
MARIYCTAAPTASKHEAASSTSPIKVGSGRPQHQIDVDLDVAGAYTLVCEDATIDLDVGQRMTAQLTINGHRGTLVLHVWDETIRGANALEHGENSPRLDGQSDGMKAAAATMNVGATLAAIVGCDATIAAGDLGAIADDMIDSFNAHIASTTYHVVADTFNLDFARGGKPVRGDARVLS